PRPAAVFDGRSAYFSVATALPLGKEDFSIAVWVYTEKDLDDMPGDIACRYDPARRKGFNLSLVTANTTTNHANHRNLYFGIDDGGEGKAWVDCGRPGKGVYVQGLAVHDGRLYAG